MSDNLIRNLYGEVLIEFGKVSTFGSTPITTTTTTTTGVPWFSPDSNTLRYYKLDNLSDSSGNDATLTNTGSVSFSGGYSTFDDSNYLVDTTFTTVPSAFTVFFWKKIVNNTSSFQFSYLFGSGSLSQNLHDNYQGTRSLVSSAWGSGGDYNNLIDPTDPPVGEWYFVAHTNNGTNQYLYSGDTSNIYLYGSGSIDSIPSSTKLTIGGESGWLGRYMDGNLSGFIVEDTTWSSSDILTQAAKGPHYSYGPQTTTTTTTVAPTTTTTTTTTIGSVTMSVLVIAGGGAGGSQGAGGGAGGYQYDVDYTIPAGSTTVTIGAGGTGTSDRSIQGSKGNDSIFGTITAEGGGGGSGRLNSDGGGDGGSGGGTNTNDNPTDVGIGSQGNDGAQGVSSSNESSGGGGGAGVVGGTSSDNNGGNGGNGTANSISSSSVTYAGGGGGSVSTSTGPGGTGGTGGGGNGGNDYSSGSAATSGTVNTGGGGGGSAYTKTAGSGGSGIVIVRYTGGTQLYTGGSVTTDGDDYIHTFTTSSSLVEI